MENALILVLNCGSSSIKFAVINPVSGENSFNGLAQCIGADDANVRWEKLGQKQSNDMPNVDYKTALEFILGLVRDDPELVTKITAVGHRVVHGGEYFAESVIIDDAILSAIRDCQDLAPLHNPANILGITTAGKVFPQLPQVAVFDTAFHQTIPKHAYLYAIPYELYEKHKIRRYGFHGTSHRFVSQKAAEILGKPIKECNFITAHLGNGCSICVIKNGKSIDTSMGLTPLEGLVMGTRSGDVDPSLHVHLADRLGYDIHKINNLLNKESGLLGISAVNSDMRSIEEAIAKDNEQAKLAVEIYCYRLAKYIGAYLVALSHIDALIFTGGIGENSSYVRGTTLSWLENIGFKLDNEKNSNHGKETHGVITTGESLVSMVVQTNEELLIAKDSALLVKG